MPPVLILPGLGSSGPEHWQTHWERTNPGCVRVAQRDWDNPDRDDWIATLDRAVALQAAPQRLVAHSLACALVAHWAARHQGDRHIVTVTDTHNLSDLGRRRGYLLPPGDSAIIRVLSHPFGASATARPCHRRPPSA